MKNLFVFLVLFFVSNPISAQSINGKVIDKNTKEPLIGVNVLLNIGGGTATDFNGEYSLKLNNSKDKEYNITFKYIGYKSYNNNYIINDNEQRTINISLEQDSEQLKTVVVSAGRFEQNLEEITVSMEVMKPSLIENKNTTNIETAIDQVPGVNITDGQANIRGGSGWSYGAGTRVLVMVDDMPLISGDAGQAQWSLIATENINQVEIIKGASSALYGSSALNGVINIRTAFPSQNDIDKNKLPGYTKVNMHMGLIDVPKRKKLHWNSVPSNQNGKQVYKRRAYKGVDFLHAMKFKHLDLTVGGNIFKDDGYRFGEITDRNRLNLNSIYKSHKIKGLSYGVNANVLKQNSGSAIIWTSLEEAYVPYGSEIITTEGLNYNIDPFINFNYNNNRHSLKTRYLSVLNDNLNNGVDVGQSTSSKTYYFDYQWQKNIEKYNLRLTTGVSYENVAANSDLFNGISKRQNSSFYTQLDKKWGKLNFSLGARYENFQLKTEEKYYVNGDSIVEFKAAKPVFRTGANYQLADGTFIRTSWGQGYRFPSMAELFISTEIADGIFVYPNAELKPENGWSAELGLKQVVKYNSWLGYIDIAGFIMQYDDMMEFTFGKFASNITEDPNDPLSATTNFYGLGFKSLNVGKTQISGIELSILGSGNISSSLKMNVLAGYTFIQPIPLNPDYIYASLDEPIYNFNGEDLITELTYNNSSSDPSVLKYRYQHLAKLDVEIVYKKISFGTSFRYNDFMQNIDAIFADETIFGKLIPGIPEARENGKKGDFIIDSRFYYQINNYIKSGLVINNLLNKEYMNRPANMMPPRTIAINCNIKI